MKKPFSIAYLLLVLSFFGCKMQNNLPLSAVTDLKIVSTYEKELELYDYFRVDAKVIKNSGIKWKTSGLGGTYSWNNLDVKVKNGYFKKGYVFFERNEKVKNVMVYINSIERPEIIDSVSVSIPYVTKIKLKSERDNLVATEKPTLNCEITFSSNKTYSTKNNKTLYDKLLIETPDALMFTNNEYNWCHNFYDVFYNKATVKSYLKSNIAISDSISLPIDYASNLVFKVNGVYGRNGQNGEDGYDGTLEQPNGFHAGSGQNGENGYKGADVLLKIKSFPFDNDLIYKIDLYSANIHNKAFLNVSKGASIQIFSNGGKGGNGGDGGKGGNGIDGSSGISPGYGGDGGNGGNAGFGGNGGNITIVLDTLAEKSKQAIYIENSGAIAGLPGNYGKSGRGGRRQSANLLQFIFTGRSGTSGNNGLSAQNGKQGQINWKIE